MFRISKIISIVSIAVIYIVYVFQGLANADCSSGCTPTIQVLCEEQYCAKRHIHTENTVYNAYIQSYIKSAERAAIISSSRKAIALLNSICEMILLEEQAMLPCHRYTIQAKSRSYSSEGDWDRLPRIYIPQGFKLQNFITLRYTIIAVTIQCILLCIVVHLYERFFYRQREAYPLCTMLSCIFLRMVFLHDYILQLNGVMPYCYATCKVYEHAIVLHITHTYIKRISEYICTCCNDRTSCDRWCATYRCKCYGEHVAYAWCDESIMWIVYLQRNAVEYFRYGGATYQLLPVLKDTTYTCTGTYNGEPMRGYYRTGLPHFLLFYPFIVTYLEAV